MRSDGCSRNPMIRVNASARDRILNSQNASAKGPHESLNLRYSFPKRQLARRRKCSSSRLIELAYLKYRNFACPLGGRQKLQAVEPPQQIGPYSAPDDPNLRFSCSCSAKLTRQFFSCLSIGFGAQHLKDQPQHSTDVLDFRCVLTASSALSRCWLQLAWG